MLQFYFRKDQLKNEAGRYTCIARNLCYNYMDFACQDIAGACHGLQEHWRELRRGGFQISDVAEYALECAKPSSVEFTALASDLEKLPMLQGRTGDVNRDKKTHRPLRDDASFLYETCWIIRICANISQQTARPERLDGQLVRPAKVRRCSLRQQTGREHWWTWYCPPGFFRFR